MQTILNILSSVGFNWHVALANFVNFLIILFLLNRFIFKKIGKTIDDRDMVIKQGLVDAQEAARAKSEAFENKNEILRNAEAEGHSIVNDAHAKAELLATKIQDDAAIVASKVISEAEEKKANARKEAEKEFAEVAPRLVVELTEKALRATMTKDLNDKIIQSVAH